jgi:diadenosine tetraphosphate (Ap4A) HIT family hydrolase
MTVDVCWFCDDASRTDPPPGGWVYEDAMWRVGHAPASYGPQGLVLLEACRHFLDVAEMTPEEASAFGPLLGRLVAAIKQVTGAVRVYLFSTMAQVPHFHAMLIPWWPTQAVRGPAYVADMPPCSPAEAERTANALRALLGGRVRPGGARWPNA